MTFMGKKKKRSVHGIYEPLFTGCIQQRQKLQEVHTLHTRSYTSIQVQALVQCAYVVVCSPPSEHTRIQ